MAPLPPHRLLSTIRASARTPSSIDRESHSASHGRHRSPSHAHRLPALAVLLVAGGSGLAAVPATASAACSGANRTVASQGASRAEKAVRCLVNERRRAAGLSALGFSGTAARAAQGHTEDMVHRHYFSHVSPGGSTIGQRADAAGMRWRKVGENIAGGQRTPARVVSAWMNSQIHRDNILNPSYRVLGVGVSKRGAAGLSGATWTQVFAKPRG